MSDPDALLERAREHCFLAGVGDVGEQLCAANMPYGIAKIHEAQRQLGHPADATFVGAPDATVTRNVKRWTQGFGYGGRIRWSGDFAVLDIKSNGCGMLVGTLPEVPEREELMERARTLVEDGLEVEGIPIEYDLDHGNHFLDVCETTSSEEEDAPPAYFVMHSSGHEHRDSSPFGCGIYYDADESLAARARIIETPWGTLSVLEGDDARWWYDVYMRVQRWNHARRAAIADALFDGWGEVINATHQGLTEMNAAHLGCYVFEDEELTDELVFPLTISADLPVYLVKPRANLSEDIAERAGFLERAEKHGVKDRVLGANLLPHGGGYRYPHFAEVEGVVEGGPDERRFRIRRTDGEVDELEHPRGQPYVYRGDEVLERMRALELGEPVVETSVRYVLRDKPMPGDRK
ncbi:MAG TPA: hypothetical protein RMH85_24950 [Polyangiaceae bacterium LLY-WYZ-15_(1-7)]|nr:hypothetical protein [Myxococcales bacterium]MBJ71763.1 hypothetical protein [Sandaracinus sp.]HJK94209.1 hypothetical protein [Polyangiaceae bacterium LLY-WYZ-15_(1-7)]HJL02521.1 hypothetical protein [Polyangiaceae bacterium LLY-WYZ-15_(1-7)]HJL11748.1 hypothetical protein [Polyangiaceae bacterium LLY-WYZ-15_(1-7)]